MIGRHSDVALLNEAFGRSVRKLVSKRVVGNKLCIPNQIEMQHKGYSWRRWLQRKGYFQGSPEADVTIEDYIQWDAQIVAIVRDGNAIISSIMKRGKQPFKVASYRWRRSIQIMMELHERHSDRLLLVSYETLVTDPECVMQSVASHLAIDYQSEMLSGYAYTPIYKNEGGIDASRAQKQTEDFGLEQRFPIEFEQYQKLLEICAQQARSFQTV